MYTGNLDATVCSDEATGVDLPGTDDDGGTITSFDISAVVDGNLTGTATTGTGIVDLMAIASDVFNNVTNTSHDVVYTVTPYFGSCAGSSFTITVTVDPEPLYTGNLDATVCSDEATGVDLPGTDDDGGTITSFDISAVVDGNLTGTATTGTGIVDLMAIASDVFNNVTNTSHDVVYTVTPYFGSCAGSSFTITVTVDPEPLYTGNLDATVCSDEATGVDLPGTDDDGGTITSFDISAVVDGNLTGTATTGTGIVDLMAIASDVFNNVTNTSHDVVYTVTPYFGSCAGSSFTIIVTVDPEPLYTGNLDATVCSDEATGVDLPGTDDDGGTITSFDISAVVDGNLTGTATTGTGIVDLMAIASDVFNNVTNTSHDVVYTVTPYFGSCAGSSFTITVTVDPEPLYTGNLDATVCSDEATGVDLPGTDDDGGTITSFDISAVVDGNLTGTATTGTGIVDLMAIASDVFNNVTNTSHDVVYTVTPYFGSCAGSSFTITVTVDPEPLYTGNLDATVCSDEATGVDLPGTDDDGGTITSFDISAVVDGNLTGTATTGTGIVDLMAIASDVFNNVTNTSHDVVYTVTPYFGSCAGSSFTIIVTVDPEPLYTGNLDATVCSDEATGVDLPGTDDDGGTITSFDISAVVDGNLTGTATTGTGIVDLMAIASDVFNNVTNTSHDVVYTVTPYFGSCAGSSFTIIVTVDPEPLYTGNLDATVCSDEATGVDLPGTDDDGGTITSFDISAVVDGNLTGTATTGTGIVDLMAIASDVFNNVTNTSHDVVYTVTPYFGSCAGSSFTITVTVDPEPLYTGNLDATVCSDEATGVDLPGTDDDGGTITSFDISAVVDGNLTGTATTGTGIVDLMAIASDVFNNVTNTSHDVVYTVTPYFGSCAGSSFTITVTVDPEPLYTGNLDATVCSDEATGVDLPGTDDDGGTITSFDISAVVDGNLTGTATTGTGIVDLMAIASDVFNNVTNTSHDVVYTVTPYFGSCAGSSFTITVTVDPEPLYTGNLDATVCSDEATGVDLPGTDDDGGTITSFDISAVVDGNLTGTATTGTGIVDLMAIASDVFNNVTNTSHDVVYTVTPYFGSCAGSSFTIIVTVDPEPLYTGNLDATVCSDEATE